MIWSAVVLCSRSERLLLPFRFLLSQDRTRVWDRYSINSVLLVGPFPAVLSIRCQFLRTTNVSRRDEQNIRAGPGPNGSTKYLPSSLINDTVATTVSVYISLVRTSLLRYKGIEALLCIHRDRPCSMMPEARNCTPKILAKCTLKRKKYIWMKRYLNSIQHIRENSPKTLLWSWQSINSREINHDKIVRKEVKRIGYISCWLYCVTSFYRYVLSF